MSAFFVSVTFSLSVLAAIAAPEKPNVVIILADDMGYADLSCYGAKGYTTPNLDRMAAEGVRFTDWHTGQPICSASRASLLTGCYPNRIGIHNALGPGSKTGLSGTEMTIADMLKAQGYATAIYGKWHLGDRAPFLPTKHGFDEWFGLPYSNDMWPNHPEQPNAYPPLPLYENDTVVKAGLTGDDQAQLTTQYAEHAVSFIRKHKDEPFFLYVAPNMPHVPLFVSDKFKGKSGAGLYGDVIMEIDWAAGEILTALREAGIDERTLVIFSSDNGPWISYGNHAGSAGIYREAKATTFEGGHRVPCIARWPKQIPAGSVCREPGMEIDVMPTVARLTGGKLPEHKIDGMDLWPLFAGESGAKNPHEAYCFYSGVNELQAVRSGDWKLFFPHTSRTLDGPAGKDGKPGKYKALAVGLELYDLAKDPEEKNNVAAANPEVVARLTAFADKAREDMGDKLTKSSGSGTRAPGTAK